MILNILLDLLRMRLQPRRQGRDAAHGVRTFQASQQASTMLV
jgi:hypothetical protein